MPKILVSPENQEIAYLPGKSLLQILVEHNLYIQHPCNGLGKCGKCKVKLETPGLLPEPAERALLSLREVQEGYRLACYFYPTEDICIALAEEKTLKILTEGEIPDFQVQPLVRKKTFQLAQPAVDDNQDYESRLLRLTNAKAIIWPLLKKFSFKPGVYTAVIHDETIIALREEANPQILGLAIDLGTTTIAASLVDLESARELGAGAILNPQKAMGMDVISRISFVLEHPENGLQKLQSSVCQGLNELISSLCQKHQVSPESIYDIVVAANNIMTHLLLGVDPKSLGKFPYTPVFTKAKTVLAADLNIRAAENCRLRCLPSVSAYIGSDVVAGVQVSKLSQEKGNAVLIDIGTNGEIVLSKAGELFACSCAAGPALEGMNISHGMQATQGAIEVVRITPEGIDLKIIGGQEPLGLCGSGIISAVKELLKIGLISQNGSLLKEESLPEDDYRRRFFGEGGICLNKEAEIIITQKDIRHVQLAKGAILSGFQALLEESGLDISDLDKVIIAGQFGAYLPLESLLGIGILPKALEQKIIYAGNSAKMGAYMGLLSPKDCREMAELALKINYFELGAKPNYNQLFIECMAFPDSPQLK